MDRHQAARLDAYLTREPPWSDDEPREYRCGECGEALPEQAVLRTDERTFAWCDGKPSVIECEHDEAVLRIIGEDRRGEKFKVAYTAACGTREGGPNCSGRPVEEISELFVEEYTHDPHWFEEEMGFASIYVRRCSNGHVTKEVVQ